MYYIVIIATNKWEKNTDTRVSKAQGGVNILRFFVGKYTRFNDKEAIDFESDDFKVLKKNK